MGRSTAAYSAKMVLPRWNPHCTTAYYSAATVLLRWNPNSAQLLPARTDATGAWPVTRRFAAYIGPPNVLGQPHSLSCDVQEQGTSSLFIAACLHIHRL